MSRTLLISAAVHETCDTRGRRSYRGRGHCGGEGPLSNALGIGGGLEAMGGRIDWKGSDFGGARVAPIIGALPVLMRTRVRGIVMSGSIGNVPCPATN